MKKIFKSLKKKDLKKKVIKALPVAVTAGLAAGSAFAGTDTTFDSITTTLNDWASGSLGKALTLGTLLVGGGYAVATQSAKSAIATGGIGLILAYGPGVVQGIFTALF